VFVKISSAPYLGKLVDFDKGQGVGDFGFIGQSEPVALPTLRKRAVDRCNSAFVHCIEHAKTWGLWSCMWSCPGLPSSKK
jgi:hypothetical protein